MGEYAVLIFDADETLFDYSRGELYALEATLSQCGIAFDRGRHPDQYRSINHRLWQDYERGAIDRDSLRSERFAQFLREIGDTSQNSILFGERYLENLGDAGFMLPGAMKLLEQVHGDYILALLTNGFSEVQRSRIAKTGTGRFFDTIIISDEVNCQKPQKEIFDILLDSIDHDNRRDVLMIGDSLTSDILGGINAGIDTCWYNRSGARQGDPPGTNPPMK